MKLQLREFILALAMALGLWYGVSGSEKMETQVEVRVDYRGVPSNLVITDGLVSKVTARVRASGGQLRTLSGRDYAYSMDLSSLIQGKNILPIVPAQMPFWGGIEVIDVSPSRIALDVDVLQTKSVPVSVDLSASELQSDFEVTSFVEPKLITIKGPSTIVETINSLLVKATVDGTPKEGSFKIKKAISVPDSVDALPSQVDILVQVQIKRKEVSVRVPAQVHDGEGLDVSFEPREVVVKVAVPISYTDISIIKNSIKAVVKGSLPASAEVRLPIELDMPQEFLLISVEPSEVLVSRHEAAKKK